MRRPPSEYRGTQCTAGAPGPSPKGAKKGRTHAGRVGAVTASPAASRGTAASSPLYLDDAAKGVEAEEGEQGERPEGRRGSARRSNWPLWRRGGSRGLKEVSVARDASKRAQRTALATLTSPPLHPHPTADPAAAAAPHKKRSIGIGLGDEIKARTSRVALAAAAQPGHRAPRWSSPPRPLLSSLRRSSSSSRVFSSVAAPC